MLKLVFLAVAATLAVVAANGPGRAAGTGSASGADAAGPAQEVTAGALRISAARAGATHKGQQSDAGYLTIRNTGDTDDTLTALDATFARLELHLSSVDANGVARMQPVSELTIPAHGEVVLKEGGYHIMMTALTHPLRAGTTAPAVLTFRKAGKVKIAFAIGATHGAAMKMKMGD